VICLIFQPARNLLSNKGLQRRYIKILRQQAHSNNDLKHDKN